MRILRRLPDAREVTVLALVVWIVFILNNRILFTFLAFLVLLISSFTSITLLSTLAAIALVPAAAGGTIITLGLLLMLTTAHARLIFRSGALLTRSFPRLPLLPTLSAPQTASLLVLRGRIVVALPSGLAAGSFDFLFFLFFLFLFFFLFLLGNFLHFFKVFLGFHQLDQSKVLHEGTEPCRREVAPFGSILWLIPSGFLVLFIYYGCDVEFAAFDSGELHLNLALGTLHLNIRIALIEYLCLLFVVFTCCRELLNNICILLRRRRQH